MFGPTTKCHVIRNLDPYSIGIYQELEFLDLSKNGIVELPIGFLNELSQLKELRFQNNRLKVVDDQMFRKLSQLQRLDLSHNEIEQIMPRAFNDLTELTWLNLSSNQIHMLEPSALAGLSELVELDFANNRLSRLTSDMFSHLPAVRVMNLSRNLLFKIPDSLFSKQRELSQLDLSSNIITDIEPHAFANLQSIVSIDLSKNLLTNIPQKNWPFLHHLKILDLSYNRFSSIPTSAFDGLRSLNRLKVSNIKELESIQANAFVGLDSLSYVDISNSPSLAYFDTYAFEHPNAIRHFDISNNALTTLDSNLLNWDQLVTLDLAGNPWNCDCKLNRFLPRTLARTRPVITAYCATPEQMFNVPVEDAVSAYCTSLSETALTIIAVGGFLLLLTLIMLLLFCLRSRLPCRSTRSNNSRLPLYATGSSFTDSLTYDKTFDPLLAAQTRIYQQKPPRLPSTDNEESNEYYSSILFHPISQENASTMFRQLPPGNISPRGIYTYGRAPLIPPQMPPPPPPPIPPENGYRVISSYPPMTEL
uniref:Uncharacterized protein n=1 Tax=Acrobeloides nanus TaxID=290746 RepID=A0A914CMT5_9BILA